MRDQTPKMNGNMKESLGEEALNALEAIGCIVDTRGSIHQKAAIIDDEITWFGSLNPLSHTSKTEETMARIKDKRFAGQLSQNLAIKFSKETEGLSIKKKILSVLNVDFIELHIILALMENQIILSVKIAELIHQRTSVFQVKGLLTMKW